MRTFASLLAILSLAAAALAQDGKPAEPTKPEPAPSTTTPAASTPPASTPPGTITLQPPAATPPMPKAIPVPSGEAVKTETLEGGLIVEDLKIGEGFEVKPGGAVVALYHGTLKENGKVFDSAFERGEPIAFPLNGVIPGWQKGVPGMKIGGIRRLTIPSALAYGAQGAGADIPPNSDLVFIIQLVDALQWEETKAGEGEAASLNCVAVTVHTITDSTGKVIDSSTVAKPYIWFPGEFQAIQLALDGMKPGAKRKIKVPAQMNESAPQIQSARPSGVPLTMEVELIAVRNLPMPRNK